MYSARLLRIRRVSEGMSTKKCRKIVRLVVPAAALAAAGLSAACSEMQSSAGMAFESAGGALKSVSKELWVQPQGGGAPTSGAAPSPAAQESSGAQRRPAARPAATPKPKPASASGVDDSTFKGAERPR